MSKTPRKHARKARRNPYADTAHATHDLVLTTTNDGDLYRQQAQPIIASLAKKMAKGNYSRTLAAKAWGYFVENGARKIAWQQGKRKPGTTSWRQQGADGNGLFPKKVRDAAAAEVEEHYREEVEEAAAAIKAKAKKNPRDRFSTAPRKKAAAWKVFPDGRGSREYANGASATIYKAGPSLFFGTLHGVAGGRHDSPHMGSSAEVQKWLDAKAKAYRVLANPILVNPYDVVHFQSLSDVKGKRLSRHRTLAAAQKAHAKRVLVGGKLIPDYQSYGIVDDEPPRGRKNPILVNPKAKPAGDDVVFRVFPEGDIIALFPKLKSGRYIMSYQHVGQHSEASPELIRTLKKAPEGPKLDALRRELTQIGYNLRERGAPARGKK